MWRSTPLETPPAPAPASPVAAAHEAAKGQRTANQQARDLAKERRDQGRLDCFRAGTLQRKAEQVTAFYWPTLEELATLIQQGGSRDVMSFTRHSVYPHVCGVVTQITVRKAYQAGLSPRGG